MHNWTGFADIRKLFAHSAPSKRCVFIQIEVRITHRKNDTVRNALLCAITVNNARLWFIYFYFHALTDTSKTRDSQATLVSHSRISPRVVSLIVAVHYGVRKMCYIHLGVTIGGRANTK